MTAGRRGIAITPMETRREVILRAAVLADDLGYEVFSVAEGWGLDASLLLAEIALRTRRINLLSGVLSVWGRTPATLAMTAATLHQISGGRFVLGLGPSTRSLVEGFHTIPFIHPADQLRDVTTRVRALLAGELPGPTHHMTARPLRLGIPPVPDLPIWLAALGNRTVQVAAELADGWFPFYVGRDRVSSWTAELSAARRAVGVRPDPLTVAAGPTVVVDQDAQVARRITAASVAWYLGAMGDVYARVVSEQGYAAEVQAIRSANPKPRLHDGVVPPEAEVVLDQFTASGTATQVREHLERWDPVVDVVMLVCPAGVPWTSLEAALRAAAPSNPDHEYATSAPLGARQSCQYWSRSALAARR
jgi:alkanesulfonate monooxygenase SsuD/methylene tetrahydromethanopterin reductase-like flavin-dependent oxidoreductase (luciferase family)